MEGVLYLELTSALVRFRFSPDFSEITPFFELPDFFVNFRIRTSNKPCYCPTPKKVVISLPKPREAPRDCVWVDDGDRAGARAVRTSCRQELEDPSSLLLFSDLSPAGVNNVAANDASFTSSWRVPGPLTPLRSGTSGRKSGGGQDGSPLCVSPVCFNDQRQHTWPASTTRNKQKTRYENGTSKQHWPVPEGATPAHHWLSDVTTNCHSTCSSTKLLATLGPARHNN